MTDLVPIKIAGSDDDLKKVLARLTGSRLVEGPEKPVEPQTVVPLTPEAKAAVERLSDELRTTSLPAERRVLTPDEGLSLMKLHLDVREAEKALTAAKEAVKAAVFAHLDVELERKQSTANIPVDPKTGSYLTEGKVQVGGVSFVRQIRRSDPDLKASDLAELHESGIIDDDTYNSITKEAPRQIDEAGLLAMLREKPELLSVIEAIVEPGKVTAAFTVEKEKNG